MEDHLSDETRAFVDALLVHHARRSAIVWSWPSIFGYVWDVIRNLIVIAVVLAIYRVLNEPFQVIVVSILILTYVTLVVVSAQLSRLMADIMLHIERKSNDVLKQLGKEQDEGSTTDFEEAGFLLEKLQYKSYVNGTFNFIIYLIVVFQIFGNI